MAQQAPAVSPSARPVTARARSGTSGYPLRSPSTRLSTLGSSRHGLAGPSAALVASAAAAGPRRLRCRRRGARGGLGCRGVAVFDREVGRGQVSQKASIVSGAAAAAVEGLTDAPSQIDLVVRSISGYARAALWLAPYVPLYLATESAASRGEGWDPDGALAQEWRVQHTKGAADMADFITEMQGFYVKVGQLIATRVDLFPKEYSAKLDFLVDSVNPLPFEVVRRVIEDELLEGYSLDEVFEHVDPQPLGSASIAQVHRAKLKNGKEVAIKVQRPNVEARLLDDISVIKSLAQQLRDVFPVDYYAVFSELEDQLKDEFDFCLEASAMDRLAVTLSEVGSPPVFVPRSVPGLVSKRVLCMDFVPGLSLSQLSKHDSVVDATVAKVVGRRILSSLTSAFGKMILEEGFFHADPHPGNVYVMPDGTPALIDFGQVKRIGYKFRREFAELVLLVADCTDTQEEYDAGIRLGQRMGVKFSESADELAPVALGLFVLDWSRPELPGGYSAYELSPRNVMNDVTYFPREWVLTCRAMQLIRGLAERLDVEWSLPEKWRESARRALGRGAGGRGAGAARRGFWHRARSWWSARGAPPGGGPSGS